MSLHSLDSLFNVSELYQTFMGGSMSSFQPIKEIENVEVPIGGHLKPTGALEGWTLWHFDVDASEGQWGVTAGPAHIKKLNEENAGKGLAALPENFRRVYSTKEKALDFIVKFTPQTLVTKLGDMVIPPYLVPQILTSVALIVGNPSPNAKRVNLVTGTQREIKRQDRLQKTVKELVVLRSGLNPDSPIRHLQYPDGENKRNTARLYFELIDFMGKKMVHDVTPEDAKAFLRNVKQRRHDENRAEKHKTIGPGLLHHLFIGVNAMFKYALVKQWCDENPFEELYAEISKNAAEHYQKRKDDRKPHEIKTLQALIRAAWQENKLICFAFLLAMLEGLRRCEIMRAPGSCIRLTGRCPHIRVDRTMVKKRTEIRFVPISPGFNAWLPVFINILQLKRICPFSEGRYDQIYALLRKKVGLEGGGHDELRKDWTQGNQAEIDMPDAVRAWIEGQSQDVMRLHYNGDGSPEFTEELETMLDPVSILGEMPPVVTLEELNACLPNPLKIGGRGHKKYKARMEALRLEDEKNKAPGSGDA